MSVDARPAGRLGPETRLHPAAEVLIELDGTGETTLAVGWRRVPAGRYGPLILDVFRPGRTLADGLRRLSGRVSGPAEWMRAASVVREAVDAGALVTSGDAADPPGPPPRRRRGYAAAGVHRAMLDDTARTRAFCDAVARTVRPGDVVVDIGTGSGILAVAAARAGARRVYALETSDIAEVATQVAAANGYGDVIEVVRGWSTEIDLPERGDVLVTEMIGDHPLGEQILPIMADAAERLLRPGAAVIPRALQLWAWPLEPPAGHRALDRVTPEHVTRWSAAYGIDLSPLARADLTRPRGRPLPATDTGTWRRLGSATIVACLPLPPTRHHLDTTAELALTAPGRLGAVALGFRARLADGVDLTVGPGTPGTHWRPFTWLLPEPLPVRSGDRARVRMRHTLGAELDVSVRPGRFRYRLAGLDIDSAVPLRDLDGAAVGGDGAADVELRLGPCGPGEPPTVPGPRARLGPAEARLTVGRARLRIRDGRELVLDAPEPADDQVQLTVLGAGLAALVLQRGLVPLHASTVVGPAGAVALCGARGAGKTTLAAWLDREGLALLADDLTPVRVDGPAHPPGVTAAPGPDGAATEPAASRPGAAVSALPGVRRLKLREDALRSLDLDPDRHPALLMDGETRWPVPAWSPAPAGDAHPLTALVVVQPDDAVAATTVERVTAASAAAAVRGACFRPRWLTEAGIGRTVAAASLAVAATVPVLCLRRPTGAAGLAGALDVLRLLAGGGYGDAAAAGSVAGASALSILASSCSK